MGFLRVEPEQTTPALRIRASSADDDARHLVLGDEGVAVLLRVVSAHDTRRQRTILTGDDIAAEARGRREDDAYRLRTVQRRPTASVEDVDGQCANASAAPGRSAAQSSERRLRVNVHARPRARRKGSEVDLAGSITDAAAALGRLEHGRCTGGIRAQRCGQVVE